MTDEQQPDLDAVARAILDANHYMTLGTADADGRPWVSPVFFAADGYRELYWISSPRRPTRATWPPAPSSASSCSTPRRRRHWPGRLHGGDGGRAVRPRAGAGLQVYPGEAGLRAGPGPRPPRTCSPLPVPPLPGHRQPALVLDPEPALDQRTTVTPLTGCPPAGRAGKVPEMAGADALEQGRRSFARQAWADACPAVGRRRRRPAGPEDLERLAMAAYLIDGTTTAPTSGRAPITSSCDEARSSGPCEARSGWASASSTRATRPGVAAGWPGPAGCSTTPSSTASNRATWCSRGDAGPHARGHRGRRGRLRRGDQDRRSLRGPGPAGAGPARPRRDAAGRGGDDRRRGPARRGHDRRRGRRAVAVRGRDRVLRGDRGLPGDLRPAPGPAVDGLADPLVRRPARPGPSGASAWSTAPRS